jgi:hypothetical protein
VSLSGKASGTQRQFRRWQLAGLRGEAGRHNFRFPLRSGTSVDLSGRRGPGPPIPNTTTIANLATSFAAWLRSPSALALRRIQPLVVDETSMVDILLMMALLKAVSAADRFGLLPKKCHHQKRPVTRLILIFDRQARHCRPDRGLMRHGIFHSAMDLRYAM